MKHTGKCPNCGGDVPHNHYYCSERCGNMYRAQQRNRNLPSAPVRTGRGKRERYLALKLKGL
jgi:hypothetical protein